MNLTILLASICSALLSVNYDSCVEGATMETLIQTFSSYYTSQEVCKPLIMSRVSELGCKKTDNYWLMELKRSFIDSNSGFKKKEKAKKVARCTKLRTSLATKMRCRIGDTIEKIDVKEKFLEDYPFSFSTTRLIAREQECSIARGYINGQATNKTKA